MHTNDDLWDRFAPDADPEKLLKLPRETIVEQIGELLSDEPLADISAEEIAERIIEHAREIRAEMRPRSRQVTLLLSEYAIGKLRRRAERHGFIHMGRGPTHGQGNVSAFVDAIATGELITLMMGDEMLQELRLWLLEQLPLLHEQKLITIIAAAEDIIAAIEEA